MRLTNAHEGAFVGLLVHSSLRKLATRVRSLVDALRGSYWLVPMAMAVSAGALAWGVVLLDHVVDDAVLTRSAWMAPTDADGARAVLSVIAGSMITVTGVVFSIVVVALTLASSQFGSRLLRNFLRDRANQIAFGTFVATFLYSLIVLRSVRSTEVPQLATALAVVLATLSLFVLIYFIHHIATSIQASSVIAAVARELDTHIDNAFPIGLGEPKVSPSLVEGALADLASDGRTVLATSSGFVRVLDEDAALKLATEHNLTAALHRRPGDFVAEGIAFARVGPRERATDEIVDAMRDSLVLGDHRTPVQDIRFLIGQLTEMAVRALSPGVNDPKTARDCVYRLGAVLCRIGDREMPSGTRLDDDRVLRIITPRLSFEEIVSICLDPIRRHGGEDVSIVTTVLDAIDAAAECCADASRRQVLADHANQIHEAFEAGDRRCARDLAEARAALTRALRRLEVAPTSDREASPTLPTRT